MTTLDRAEHPPLGTWQDTRAWGAALIVAHVVLAALPVALALLLGPPGGGSFLEELAMGAGLMGFALIALQVASSARIRCVDRPFGLDVVMQFHKGMAILAAVLLMLHPVLLAVGGHGWHLFSFTTSWRVNLGKLALLLLILTVAFALLRARLGVGYQVWRLAHKGAILVVIIGFFHGLAIGRDLSAPGLRAYWWLLLVMALCLFTYRNVFVPLWGRRRFKVVSVVPETHDTFTVAMEAEDGRPLCHCPGQFMFLKLDRPGRPSEEHPFTISSSPGSHGPLSVTVKKSGDFTNTIDRTRPGDRARIEAPYGRFSFVHHDPKSFLFIAGGVGITPVMSMIRCLADAGDERPVLLIYGNKTEGDIIFRRELADLPAGVRVVHVLSEPREGWPGLKGYVTRAVIEQNARDVLGDADVYLCGPPPMMDAVIRSLRDLGVPPGRIHYERFAI